MSTVGSSQPPSIMNLITDQLPPPPLPLQPPRSSFSCDRHHNDTFTGFCPTCLSERLTILDQSATTAADLRRTKSFSVSNNKESRVFQPHRKSCDVNTLSSLFSIDDGEVTNLNDLEDEIVEMEAKIDEIVDNLKSFNHHVDLDLHSKKSNFWSAASGLSKKWKGKQRNLCDITPRSSLDTGRVSFDGPRASWDGYSIGRSFPRLPVRVAQSNMQIPVEEPTKLFDYIPGGSIQTREYYLNASSSSSSKRRKSFERSNSIKMAEVSNSKVSPAAIDYNRINCRSKFRSIGGESELRSLCSESFDKKTAKKSRWWNWKLSGFISRKAANHGDITSAFNRKLSRSNTGVSFRNTKSNSIENSNNCRIRDEFVFVRNTSARY